MKLGLWLPYRESLSSVSSDTPGYLLKSVRDKIIKSLENDKDIKVIHGLDFRKALIKNGSAYIGDFCFDDLDVFMWFGEISREQNAYPIEVLKIIANRCKVINNPFAYEIGLDKFTSLELLRKTKITVPEIMLTSQNGIENARTIFKKWKEVAIKPRNGSYGIGMVRVSDEQTFVDVLDYGEKTLHTISSDLCLITLVSGLV